MTGLSSCEERPCSISTITMCSSTYAPRAPRAPSSAARVETARSTRAQCKGSKLVVPNTKIESAAPTDHESKAEQEVELTNDQKEVCLQQGFAVYEAMKLQEVPPNEATLTAVARLAVAKKDGSLAFDMVKQMAVAKLSPSVLDASGVCQECGEQLVTIDIDPKETELFSNFLSELACQRESKNNEFKEFQGWLDRHGPLHVIVDGANVGLFQGDCKKHLDYLLHFLFSAFEYLLY